jgi:hypothetical protein
MFSKFCAIVLVVLIVTPFTAPFSICDFHMALAKQTRQSTPERTAHRLETETALATAVPLVRTIHRIRTTVLAQTDTESPPGSLRARAIGARNGALSPSPTARMTALRV